MSVQQQKEAPYDNNYKVRCTFYCGVVVVKNPKTLRLPKWCPKCGVGAVRLLSEINKK